MPARASAPSTYYDDLDEPERRTWLGVGSLEVAVEQQRVRELHRRRNHAEAYGLRGEVVTPDRAGDLLPVLDKEAILAAYHVASDGLCKAGMVCHVAARARRGAGRALLRPDARDRRRQRGRARARGARPRPGRSRPAPSSSAAACGARSCRALVGRPIPMQPMQHLFAWTNPLPSLRGAEDEATHPILRHQDRDLYYRQRGDVYGIGSYDHDSLPIDVPELERGSLGHQVAQGAVHARSTSRARCASSQALVPAVHEAGIAESFNGHFAFTIDGNPLLGPSSFVDGLWLAEALWVTHAAGGARAVADVLLGRDPGLELGRGPSRPLPAAPRGAGLRAGARLPAVRRGIRRPAPGAAAAAPARPAHGALPPALRGARRAADGERRLGARAVVRAATPGLPEPPHRQTRDDWSSLFWSEIVEREHHATRTAAGLFDLTPFTKVEVEGPGAVDWLNRVCASEMDRPVGRVVYTTVLDHRGGVVCDLTVTRLADDRFLVVTGGGSGPRDVAWLRGLLPEGGAVSLRDVTSAWAVRRPLGPARPRRAAAARRHRPRRRRLPVHGARGACTSSTCRRSRCASPTPASSAGSCTCRRSTAAGRGTGCCEAGARARRSRPAASAPSRALRIEKGYRFAGVDMYREHTPDEAGLGFTVHLGKGPFVGREAVIAAREAGPRRSAGAASCSTTPNAQPLGGEPVRENGVPVGRVTSAAFGASVGESIAYAWLPPRWPSPGRARRCGCSTASWAASWPASRAGTRAASACGPDARSASPCRRRRCSP